MKVFSFELLRTYSTNFDIEAENQEEAIELFNQLGDEMYDEELSQCNVIEEVVKGDKYARSCNCCGKGMNEGYFANDEYFCSDICLHTEYTPAQWEKLSSDGVEAEEGNDEYYWTEWEDETDYQYQIINGTLEEIN
jgi:hypothetical protein